MAALCFGLFDSWRTATLTQFETWFECLMTALMLIALFGSDRSDHAFWRHSTGLIRLYICASISVSCRASSSGSRSVSLSGFRFGGVIELGGLLACVSVSLRSAVAPSPPVFWGTRGPDETEGRGQPLSAGVLSPK